MESILGTSQWNPRDLSCLDWFLWFGKRAKMAASGNFLAQVETVAIVFRNCQSLMEGRFECDDEGEMGWVVMKVFPTCQVKTVICVCREITNADNTANAQPVRFTTICGKSSFNTDNKITPTDAAAVNITVVRT